ncbi:MAG TPA: phytanoyl-CoA dioxygenase family protein [Candidatus Binataceae bacterium]|nr:phytanoyl-CoA dioxygenase family protein [Candidatus Binataceae bacterium]
MVFKRSEIDQFIADGYVVLRGAFAREVADQCREFIWNQVPLWDDCTTYGQPMVQIRKVFNGAPFDQVRSERLKSGLDQMVGTDRWQGPAGYGWWSLLFPGFQGPGGWHVDGGDFQLTEKFTDHNHALVTLFLFSDIGPGDGGTAMVRGSHLAVTRLIGEIEEARPSTINWEELKLKPEAAELMSPAQDQIVHLTGEAGDVALMHPFLLHGFGANRGSRIRFACNPLFQLKEPPQLDRPDGAYSPVEAAIRKAIRS